MTPSENPKRFYKDVTVSGDGPYMVNLDGRIIKTPAKVPLGLPTKALAEAISAEWAVQGERIDIGRMHLTRLANVAIDRTPETRVEMAQEIANYVGTDLLCYLAEGPAELCQRQASVWAPLRDWAGKSLGIVTVPVEGIIPTPQPPASLDAAKAHALGFDDFRLTGLAYACGLFGSAILALAVAEGRISAGDAYSASRLDEDFQIERWGEDEEAKIARQTREVEARAVGTWFRCMREG